jgi:hypothetical protein
VGLAVAGLVGCEAGGGAVPVSGTVTFQGEPVKQGEIIFTPADGATPSVAEKIVDGKYALSVPKGRSQVKITGYRDTGKVDTSNPGQETPIIEMYIPEEYNSKSTLEVTVEKADSDLNFPLGK